MHRLKSNSGFNFCFRHAPNGQNTTSLSRLENSKNTLSPKINQVRPPFEKHGNRQTTSTSTARHHVTALTGPSRVPPSLRTGQALNLRRMRYARLGEPGHFENLSATDLHTSQPIHAAAHCHPVSPLPRPTPGVFNCSTCTPVHNVLPGPGTSPSAAIPPPARPCRDRSTTLRQHPTEMRRKRRRARTSRVGTHPR